MTNSARSLESMLWDAANILRGPVDASDFKAYVFPLLFLKRISDVYDEERAVALAESGGDEEDLLARSALGEFDTAADVAVFASHLHVTSARTSTEKEINVSSEYATDPAHIDGGYGYLAFGHIHIAQAVAGNRGRYRLDQRRATS